MQTLCADIDGNINVGNAVAIDVPEHCRNFLTYKSNGQLRILSQNIRSINKNFDGLQILLERLAVDLDIIILTECWLSKNIQVPIIPSFRHFTTKRNYNQNDGVIIYIKNNIDAEVIEPTDTEEVTCLVVVLGDVSVIGVYRPHEFNNKDKFNQSIDRILTTYKKGIVILLGDMNIDIKDGNNANNSAEYLDILATHGLLQTHNFLTTDKSCLDHCFVKSNCHVTTVVCNSTLTDHACIIFSLAKSPNRKDITHKVITTINYKSLSQHLFEINWQEILLYAKDPNDATNIFLKIVAEGIKQHSFTKTTSNRKTNIKPWITPGLIRCISHRDRLHKKQRKDPENIILKVSYSRYRNYCNRILKNVKNEYYRFSLQKNENNLKNQWSIIKQLCHMDKDKGSHEEILKMKSNHKDALNYANQYFVNVGKQLANTILDRRRISETSLIRNNMTWSGNPNSLVLLPTDVDEIKQVINSLKPSSACGWDGLSSMFFKLTKNSLATPVTIICNMCLEQGIFPDALKKSIVIPIYKAGDRHSIANYRPISLLPTLAKILEKVINKRLTCYLEKYNLLVPNQYGFRNRRSTSDAIRQLTSYVTNQLDRGSKCIGIFLDLAKAFDTVSVPLLLRKLESVGIRGMPLRLLTDYMSNRKQSLRVADVVSDEENIHYGVPQGSVLGPTLFLIYINDLCRLTMNNGQIITFADDTVLLFNGKSWHDVNLIAENGFRLVTGWLDNNLLTLNAKKTKYLNFSIRSNSQPPSNSIVIKAHYCSDDRHQCSCTVLEETDHIRYLGINIDRHFNWHKQMSALTGRVRRLIYIFKTLRFVCDHKLLNSIYYALCQSLLTYGIEAWGGIAKTTLKTVERAQRAIIKVMRFKPYRYPTSTLFGETPFLTVRQLYIKQIILIQHIIPVIHSSKRRSDIVYKVPFCRTVFGQSYFFFLGPYLYNKFSKIISLKDLNLSGCKMVITKHLKKLSYEETENLLKPLS